jgi:hypothetical protein
VRYRVTGEPLALVICHCSECQRASGSAFGMGLITRKQHFELESGLLKSFTRSSDSGRLVVCSFCPECGTRIHHEPSYLEGVFNVRAGTLDDTSGLKPTMEAWTASRQDWLQLPAFPRSMERQA